MLSRISQRLVVVRTLASSQSAVNHSAEDSVGGLVYKEVDYRGHDSDAIVHSAAYKAKELRPTSALNSLAEEDRLTDIAISGQNLEQDCGAQVSGSGISFWNKEQVSTELNEAASFVVQNCQTSSPGVSLTNCSAPGTLPQSSNLQNTGLSYLHFPGSNGPRQAKFLMSSLLNTHPSRQLHTSAVEDFPQGIQADDEDKLRAWMESSRAYHLGNVSEGESRLCGGANVDELLLEQQEMLDHVAAYIKSADCDIQGVQSGPPNTAVQQQLLDELNTPCPQGVQGHECVRYKMWLANCLRFGFEECQQQLEGWHQGKRTLSDILLEQDNKIREVVQHFRAQLKH